MCLFHFTFMRLIPRHSTRPFGWLCGDFYMQFETLYIFFLVPLVLFCHRKLNKVKRGRELWRKVKKIKMRSTRTFEWNDMRQRQKKHTKASMEGTLFTCALRHWFTSMFILCLEVEKFQSEYVYLQDEFVRTLGMLGTVTVAPFFFQIVNLFFYCFIFLFFMGQWGMSQSCAQLLHLI